VARHDVEWRGALLRSPFGGQPLFGGAPDGAHGVPSLRRFAPADGCRGVSRGSADRAHDPFGSRWRRRGRFRLPPVRAHVSLAARPRPTVSVGGSTELIGFFAKGSADRGFAVGLLGFAPVCGPCPPPFVFCGGPILPWVLVASLRMLRDDGCARTGDSGAFTVRSVSCDAHTSSPRAPGESVALDGLDIRPARPPLDPFARAVVCK
jgi:hypothetical protein